MLRTTLTRARARLGVDTYVDDPLTDFKITLEAYPKMGELIRGIGVPTIFLLEGCDPALLYMTTVR